MRAHIPMILVAAGLLAACQTTPPPTNVRTGEGMVNPATGILDPKFNDGSFSLSFVIEDHLGRALSNSDRREIDNAVDLALGQHPNAPGHQWTNPLRGHSGIVDLAVWRIDTRAGELCGTIEHSEKLKRRYGGAVTICRASIDPSWRIDEVVWDKKVSVYTPNKPTKPTTTTTTTTTTPTTGGGATNVGTPGAGVNYGAGSGGTTTTNTTRNPASKDCTVQANSGAVTLGDCLAQPSN